MKNIFLPEALILFLAVLLLTVLYEKLLIPILRRRKAAQPILEIGPSWHLTKSGTPTMGGLATVGALFSVLFFYALFLLLRGRTEELMAPALLFSYALLCGAIGFFDDYRKLVKHRNLGLSASAKFFLLLLVSAIFLLAARITGLVDTVILLPLGKKLDLGMFYSPVCLIFLTGIVNALNLTDGIDGLLSSVTAVVSAFLLFFGFVAQSGLSIVTGSLLLGCCIGFLFFNLHPAKVFMGDTGSLFLGGAVAGAGILLQRPVTVLIAGGIYIAEAASVILQVLYFKCTHGKRLFLMAPLHHHFEKRGWPEEKIVFAFSAITVLLSAVAFLLR